MENKNIGAYALCFFITIILVVSCSSKATESKVVNYEIEVPIVLPDEPGYTDDYVFSNLPQERWEKEDVEHWFVIPEGENLDRLNAANDQLIKDILEAAP